MSLIKTLQQIGGRVVEKAIGNDEAKFDANITGEFPWAKQTSDAFFPRLDIDGDRAQKIYPYKLLVIDSRTNKLIEGQGASGDLTDEFVSQKSDVGGLLFSLKNTRKWEFTLPITPQQLSITDQYAINTTATMRGIVEEHNGVKFKMIQASGTTGIWPSRSTFEDPQSGDGNTLFGGTLEALGNLQTVANSFTQKQDTKQNNGPTNTNADTGYYQALLLQQFLEQYAMAKKNPLNKHWRLVWHSPKTNESYVVTPLQYTVTRSQRSPQEFLYNMQFKAWKRIKIGESFSSDKANLDVLTPSFFQQLNSSLDTARSLMSASLNVIKAVRADFRKPFDTLRKVTLLAKDFAGVAVAISDLPNQIAQDITSATQKRVRDLTLATGGSSIGGSEVRSRVAQAKIAKTTRLIKQSGDSNEGQNAFDVESGENGKEAKDAQKTSPLNNVFNEPEGNFDFFNAINVDELDLTPQQRNAIQDEIELNSLISIEEIRGFIQETQDLILDLTNNFGAGDAFFSTVFNRPAPRKRATTMTTEEFELIKALEDSVLNMNLLIATRQFDDVRSQSSLEYVGGLAEESGITFNSSSTAKYLAPIPFGLTMEQISARYLGNPERYNEIITLNNLKSPYIDEDGFFYSFLSNGDGRQFNINTNVNLYTGQQIQLSSNTVPMFVRKISAIEKITDSNYLITVDGLADLNFLTTNDQAKMKGFLPGTVNSQNQIYIPSNETVADDPRTFDIPFLKGDELKGLSKVDWLMDESGDIVLNSFGEAALANGLTNIVQALKMKVSTQKGSLLSDPQFGLGLTPGINVTDVSIEGVLKDLKDMVLQDSRFEAVDKIEISVLPPTVSITIQARLANGRGLFPINFTV